MAADTTKKHFIRIRGANVNNLKNLSVDIPRDKFVVFTGLPRQGRWQPTRPHSADPPGNG